MWIWSGCRRSPRRAMLSTRRPRSCPAFMRCGVWTPTSPCCPRAGRLRGGNTFESSSPLSPSSLSTDCTAKAGRSLHERDLSAGESYDKKNDSHPPSSWGDLHTRLWVEPHSSANPHRLCTPVGRNVSSPPTRVRASVSGQNRESPSGTSVLCRGSFSEWP